MSSLLRGFTAFAAVAALGAATLIVSATPSEAKTEKVRFRCHVETETVSLSSRYEERTNPHKSRQEFRAQFEGSGDGLVAGAQLAVLIDSVTVGTITLKEEVPGQAEGQLRFDSRVKGKKLAFPSNFPVIDAGTMVELQLAGATVAACELN
jgi:hypothetical protein